MFVLDLLSKHDRPQVRPNGEIGAGGDGRAPVAGLDSADIPAYAVRPGRVGHPRLEQSIVRPLIKRMFPVLAIFKNGVEFAVNNSAGGLKSLRCRTLLFGRWWDGAHLISERQRLWLPP